MPFVERRKPRRFRILYMPFSRFWSRFVLGQNPVHEPHPPMPDVNPQPVRTTARTPDIPAFLLHGPEALRRKGSRRV